MKRRLINYGYVLFALGGLAFVSVNCFKAIQKAGSRRMHAVMYMFDGMNDLSVNIENAATTNPRNFAHVVGNGLFTPSTNMPQFIATNIIYSPMEILFLDVDMWRRPYNVIIVPFAATRTNVLCFHVDIWSNGANGINEDRKGDDIYIPTKTIEVHSE
jgi:hypothetical protein